VLRSLLLLLLLLLFCCRFVHDANTTIDTLSVQLFYVYIVKYARSQTLIIRLLRGGRHDTRLIGLCNKTK
jgi:hypothetical protein